MNKGYRLIIAAMIMTALVVSGLGSATARAGETWDDLVDDTRLTNASENRSSPDLAVDSSGNVHIVWQDNRDDPVFLKPEIYYTKLDGSNGSTLLDIRVTSHSDASQVPSLGVDNSGNVHIVWRDEIDGTDGIYYTKLNGSTGVDIVGDRRVSSSAQVVNHNPSLGLDSAGNVHVAWRVKVGVSNFEIYYTKLNGSNGSTLVPDTRVTSDNALSDYPSLGLDSNGNVHIAWQDGRNGNDEIYYTKLDGSDGSTILNDIRVTNDNATSSFPSLGLDSDGNVHIAWQDDRNDQSNFFSEIYYTKLNGSSGSTILDDTRVTSNSASSISPSLGLDSDNNVHIAWEDDRDNPGDSSEIYYTKLNGSDASILVDDTRLTLSSYFSMSPSLGMGSVHIAWVDDRDDQITYLSEIYYTKGCILPDTPATPSPSDGASVDVSANTLNWDDTSGADTYDVNLDTGNPPTTPICDDTTISSCAPGTLSANTIYYWQVTAQNACGPAVGSVWSFTTCNTLNTYYLDADGDGYSDGTSQSACSDPGANWYLTATSGDCDDGDAARFPGNPEVCDGKDNDCDGSIDEGVKNTYYRDADGDGHGNSASTTLACSAPSGYVTNSTDCDDGDDARFPGNPEVCDGKDNDCDNQVDAVSLAREVFTTLDDLPGSEKQPEVNQQSNVIVSRIIDFDGMSFELRYDLYVDNLEFDPPVGFGLSSDPENAWDFLLDQSFVYVSYSLGEKGPFLRVEGYSGRIAREDFGDEALVQRLLDREILYPSYLNTEYLFFSGEIENREQLSARLEQLETQQRETVMSFWDSARAEGAFGEELDLHEEAEGIWFHHRIRYDETLWQVRVIISRRKGGSEEVILDSTYEVPNGFSEEMAFLVNHQPVDRESPLTAEKTGNLDNVAIESVCPAPPDGGGGGGGGGGWFNCSVAGGNFTWPSGLVNTLILFLPLVFFAIRKRNISK